MVSLSNSELLLDFNIEVDSNRIKLLPHWRLEIRKTPEDKNICNNPNSHATELINGDESSMAPRYVCPKSTFINQRMTNVKVRKQSPVFTYFILYNYSFTYNTKYHQTRQLASELGVGDDNDWIYEDDDDWVKK